MTQIEKAIQDLQFLIDLNIQIENSYMANKLIEIRDNLKKL